MPAGWGSEVRSRSLTSACTWIAFGACLCATVPALANPLKDELRGLLVSHPDILAAEKAVGSSREGVSQLRAEYLPRIKLTGDTGNQNLDGPSQRAAPGGEPYSRMRDSATLTVTQNLFNGFSTTTGVQIAELNAEIARVSLEGTRQNTLLEGIRTYLSVMRQRRLIELAASNEENIQTQLNLEDERVQRGAGVAVDVLQAKSRLQIAKERRVTFEGGLEDAISRYVRVFNHAPDLDEMNDPPAPVQLIPESLERALDVALDENPAVVNSMAGVAVAREQKKRILSEYMPSVDLVGKWNIEKNVDAVVGVKRDYQVLLQASWDLFSGLTTSSKTTQAAYDYGAKKDIQELTARRVIEQARVSWQALLTARQRVELLENAVNIAAEVFDARQKLREAGKETVINVLDAENEIFNARINFVQAAYDEQIAIFQLLLAMGQLNADLLGIDES